MMLLDYNMAQLKEFFTAMGEKPFRAMQVFHALALGTAFEDMTDLPLALRQRLREQASEGFLRELDCRKSTDGTIKYLLECADGETVECVFLPNSYGNTVCVSTQVGCAMGCAFCTSGEHGKVRDLSAGEILAQVIAMNRAQGSGRNISNVVLMGMGEPLDNYDNVIAFLRLIGDPAGLGFSMRNISVSTCGLVLQIHKLAQEQLQVTLSISLHSAIDEKRKEIMPIARRYSVAEVMDAARLYFNQTGRRVILEYTMIQGFNVSQEDAQEIARITKGFACHVNLIPLNDSACAYTSPDRGACHAFAHRLEQLGVSASVRRSMGGDIEGACGQLRARNQQERDKA